MELDADRLGWLIDKRCGLVPLEGGGWDVVVYDDLGGKEITLANATDPRAAIDEAMDRR